LAPPSRGGNRFRISFFSYLWPLAKEKANLVLLPSSRSAGSYGSSSSSASTHKSEGFLKSIWNNLTSHHDKSDDQGTSGQSSDKDAKDKSKDDGPKKGSS